MESGTGAAPPARPVGVEQIGAEMSGEREMDPNMDEYDYSFPETDSASGADGRARGDAGTPATEGAGGDSGSSADSGSGRSVSDPDANLAPDDPDVPAADQSTESAAVDPDPAETGYQNGPDPAPGADEHPDNPDPDIDDL